LQRFTILGQKIEAAEARAEAAEAENKKVRSASQCGFRFFDAVELVLESSCADVWDLFRLICLPRIALVHHN
jgi:hypothetical protein